MRVILTGHKGYIGAVAGPLLQAAGHEVMGLDTDLFAGCDFGNPNPQIPELRRDLRDLSESDFKGFDAVVHLGALSNDPLGNLDPKLTYDINHHASVRLAELAKGAGVSRFVFSSSCSTYGAAGDDFLDETAGLHPVTPYGESKVFVERDVAYTKGKVFIKSDGTPWRPIVHIRDIIAAVINVLSAPREIVHNQVFNVGSTTENYRISELAVIVAETVPNCLVEFAPGGGPDKRCYRVNCDKIRRVLPSFRPQWTARKGAKELYDAYRALKLTYEDIERGSYVRMNQIQRLLNAGRLDASLHWK